MGGTVVETRIKIKAKKNINWVQLQLDLGNEVMKKFRLKKKTMTAGFSEKMDKVFGDYYEWYLDPSK